ncbi:MAG: hypothetical protein M3362_00730 [Acidobacteriota bacterium]|nr:hypothetical protein [Acidobacteriota bacterium]
MDLFTFGKQTFADLGEIGQAQRCIWCSNPTFYHLILVRTWLTYWFIPIFAYRREYRVECPVCAGGMRIQGDEIKAAKQGELRLYLVKTQTADSADRH